MKIITTLFFIILLCSYSYKTTCDTDKLCGKWLLVDSYDEGDVGIDTLVKMKIVSHKNVSLTYLRGGMMKNDQGDYTTTEMYTLDKGKCMIQSVGLTSSVIYNFYILHLDNHYLIESGRGMIYFYERTE